VVSARLLGALLVLATSACQPAAVPDDLGEVPAFRLTERGGKAFGSEDLRGRIWVANFIFTTCPDICPALTAQMRRLDALLPEGERPVRVSISVDPVRDTPEVLRRYAETHQVGPDWHLLTGERAAIATLLADGFHVAFADGGPPERPITHSDRFVLVDERLRIRGYYHGQSDQDLERLARDVRTLRAAAS
jgi:protein SCO1/2